METPLFFKNKNYNLFGVHHHPDPSELNDSTSGIVFCHPFAEEKLISHRVMVNLARKLSEVGMCCFRFDYMGHGDSNGNFEDSTIETRLSDIRCAVDHLKSKAGIKRVGLLGIRLGATLATLVGNGSDAIDSLILISPIIDGKSYINQCLRSNLSTQIALYKKITKNRQTLINELMDDKVVNIDGYLLTRKLYQQIKGLHLIHKAATNPQHALIVQISKNDKQPIHKEYKELCTKYKSKGTKVYWLNITDNFFWNDSKKYYPRAREVEIAVCSWLKSNYYV